MIHLLNTSCIKIQYSHLQLATLSLSHSHYHILTITFEGLQWREFFYVNVRSTRKMDTAKRRIWYQLIAPSKNEEINWKISRTGLLISP